MASKATFEHALDEYDEQLSGFPNVVGLGIVSFDEKNIKSKRLAIGVYVSHKVPRQELDESELIPEYLEVHERGRAQKLPVRVIEQGEITLEDQGIGKETL